MRRLAVLSMHTSPLAQPGTGDGGGMNVYVRELSCALARAGVACEVFTRASAPNLPATVEVEPGFRLHYIEAGPAKEVAKRELANYLEAFTDGVEARLAAMALEDGGGPEALHANYWLSGVAGHELKHRLDLPLVCTFHTLDRVKAEASPEDLDPEDPERRARAEAAVIGCSDAVLASCDAERAQLVGLYDAEPSRIAIIAPGVDRAFFSPGDQAQAQRAIGYRRDEPLLLFVGRIQPLKGVTVAVEALERLREPRCQLLIVGGPSGPMGAHELAALHRLVAERGLVDQVSFLPPQSHEALSTYYRAADLCVVPSMSESFGLVALEAAACGTPVVASAVGGLTNLVADGVTGFLVEARDAEGFARRLGQLARDPLLAAEMGHAAAMRARDYTWPAAAQQLHDLYDEITGKTLVECR
jgi:D-inositol-3-phosphate glycosyltransferase